MQIVYGDVVVDWVASKMKRGEGYGLSQGLGLIKNGKIVAGVVYNEFNGVNINAHIAIEDKTALNRKFLWMIFDYPFYQCKAKRISAFIEDENKIAIKFDTKLGFVYETKMKNAYVNGDILIYAMTKDQCKWLKYKGIYHERLS